MRLVLQRFVFQLLPFIVILGHVYVIEEEKQVTRNSHLLRSFILIAQISFPMIGAYSCESSYLSDLEPTIPRK